MFGAEADVGFREQGYCCWPRRTRGDARRERGPAAVDGRRHRAARARELARLFPWLTADGLAAGGYGRSGEGWFDPPSLAGLFRKAAQARGVEILYDDVTGIEAGARVEAVRLASGGRIACGALDQCGGSLGGRAGGAGRPAVAGRAAQALRLRDRQPRGLRGAARRAADRRSVRRMVPPGGQAVPVRPVAGREWRAARGEIR